MSIIEKIDKAKQIIKDSYNKNSGNVFISFSGGKDSTVLLHIARSIYPDIKAVYSNTTNEDLDVVKYVKTFNNIITVFPKMNFKTVIKTHGFPLVSKEVSQKVNELKHTRSVKLENTRLNGDDKGNGKLPIKWRFLAKEKFDVTHKCCNILKKEPLENWAKENGNPKPIIALMADESSLRKQLSLYGKDDGKKVYPFLKTGWTESDIWEYAKLNNIRFAECYYDKHINGILVKAEKRTGCTFCGFGIHLESESRFEKQKLKRPKHYKNMMSLSNNGIPFSYAIEKVIKKDTYMPLLNLNDYSILDTQEDDNNIYLKLFNETIPCGCKHCDHTFYTKKGTREQFYYDLPVRGKRVGLTIVVQGYKCRKCNKYFQDDMPMISKSHNMTDRLLDYIQERALSKPFTHISEETGVSESNIRNIFKKFVKSLENKVSYKTPKYLGIDEIHLAGRARAVFTNIEKKAIIDIHKNRNKDTVLKYLRTLDNNSVKVVAMDMWKPYKDSVNTVFPDATIVIDKFHVLRLANQAVETYRKELRKSLSHKQRNDLKGDRFLLLKRKNTLTEKDQFILSYWNNNFPSLSKIYELKEQFFNIYEANTKDEAYKLYEQFEVSLTDDIKHYFKDLIRAVSNWHIEIFNYFDYPVTNAYTESMNSVIRHIDRMGRSYSFETIRAKMIYAVKKEKIKVDKKNDEKEIGIDILRLSRKVKNWDSEYV